MRPPQIPRRAVQIGDLVARLRIYAALDLLRGRCPKLPCGGSFSRWGFRFETLVCDGIVQTAWEAYAAPFVLVA